MGFRGGEARRVPAACLWTTDEGCDREVQGQVWVAGLLGGSVPCRLKRARAGITGRAWVRLAEGAAACNSARMRPRAGVSRADGRRSALQRQRQRQRQRSSRGRTAEGGGRGAWSGGRTEQGAKQKQLTILSGATGAGSSLYFRALSGACDCDIVIAAAAVGGGRGTGCSGPGAGDEGAGGCSSVACAISRTRSSAARKRPAGCVGGWAEAAVGAPRWSRREINVKQLTPPSVQPPPCSRCTPGRAACLGEGGGGRAGIRDQGSPPGCLLLLRRRCRRRDVQHRTAPDRTVSGSACRGGQTGTCTPSSTGRYRAVRRNRRPRVDVMSTARPREAPSSACLRSGKYTLRAVATAVP